MRKGSITAIPNNDELKELFSLANKTPFDDRVNHFAALSDINFTLVKEYLKEIGSSLYDEADEMDFLELCRDMNLVSVLPEYVKPKNVALMFFNSQPEKFFPYATIDVKAVMFLLSKIMFAIITNIAHLMQSRNSLYTEFYNYGAGR